VGRGHQQAERSNQRTRQATNIGHFRLSPLPKRKSIGRIKTQGKVDGKFWARTTDISRECFGFLTGSRNATSRDGAKSSGLAAVAG
jgi:hypothetical protein